MALTTLSPLAASFIQPLTTSVITTNFTTLPFLTLGNTTTDLPFLLPDPSLFFTDPPSFLLDETLKSNFVNGNNNNTFTEYDYTFDHNGTVIANSSSSNDTTDTEEEINPFLAMDYNFYDYNPYDPNATLEPYDYSSGETDSGESDTAMDDEVMRLWDGVEVPPPIRPIMYNALTDLNPWFLWTPPLLCFLALFLVVLPCIILKLRDDRREKQGKSRMCGSLRSQFEETLRAEDLERQAVAASSSLPMQPRDAYSENVLHIAENDLSMKKENGKFVSKRLAVNEPPVDYRMEEYISATREPRTPSKEEGVEENLELHRYSSSSGSFIAAASGETSPGSSSERGRRTHGDEGSEEEDEEIRSHKSENFSTAPKTYNNFTGWNRDLYSNGATFGPSVRKSSSINKGGNPPKGLASPDWGMY